MRGMGWGGETGGQGRQLRDKGKGWGGGRV